MARFTVFVDGQEGTTGLEIHERLLKRDDVEILKISGEKRKDIEERGKMLNEADVVFLCLPDDAARESVSLITNPATRVLDGSTAHRTAEGWDYGIPELSATHRKAIARSKRVSVPGCYATGFTMLMYPLVARGFVPPDYPVSCHAVTGYSGGGKKLIGIFESGEHPQKLNSPCFYSLALHHKHLPEMQKHSGLLQPPLFTPIVGNFYRGMIVAVPLHTELLSKKAAAAEINAFYQNYYQGQNYVKVLPFNMQDEFEWGYMNAESCNNTNNIEILVFGDEKQILVVSRLDNLGKGASGAAVQNMNVMLNLEE
jgi:N-acetyl-gamma-glutamyl-phosphate reductase